MAESRIADTYVQLKPLLDKNFGKELQRAINNALKGVNFGALSDGLREEGRQAGREFRRGLDAGVGNSGVDLNLRDTIQEAGNAGRRSGHDFRQALDSAVGSDGVPINTQETIQEAGNDGKKAGDKFSQAFQQASSSGTPTLPTPTPAQAATQGTQTGNSFGQAFAAAMAANTQSIKDNLAGVVGVAGIFGASKFGFDKAVEFDAGTREVTASLAIASEEHKDKVTEAIKAVFKSGMVDSDWGAAEMAVESVLSSDMTLLDQPIEKLILLARRAAEIEKMFEIDMTSAVATAGQMVKQGFVKDTEEGLSLLMVSMQKLSIHTREEIIENMGEYSKHFKAMGFSARGAFQMAINAGQMGGAMGLDQTSDALKEAGIMLMDPENTTTKDALKEIGLTHKDVINNMLKGGEHADKQLEDIALGLLGVADESERIRLAGDIFGTPLEELGFANVTEVLTNIATVNDALGDTNAAAAEAGKQMEETYAASLDKIKNEAIVTFSEVFAPLLEQLVPIIVEVLKWMQENKEAIKQWIPPLLIIGAVLSTLMAIGFFAVALAGAAALGVTLGTVVGIFLALAAAVAIVWAAFNWDKVVAGFKQFRDWFNGWSEGINDAVNNWMKDMYNNILRHVGDGLLFLPRLVIEIARTIWEVIQNAYIAIVNFVTMIANMLKDIPTWFGNPGYAHNDYTEYKEIKWDLPNLPVLDTGGDIMGPTILEAAKNGEPETITNRGTTNKMIDSINRRLDSGEGVGAMGEVNLNIYQLPGESTEELADRIIDELAWRAERV